jgi:hypothetical protein
MSKARTASVRMGSWSSSTPRLHEDPVRRLDAARAAVERVRGDVLGDLRTPPLPGASEMTFSPSRR